MNGDGSNESTETLLRGEFERFCAAPEGRVIPQICLFDSLDLRSPGESDDEHSTPSKIERIDSIGGPFFSH